MSPADTQLRSELLQYCQHLSDTEQYDDEEGYHYWEVVLPGLGEPRAQSGNCTNGARLIANKFGGVVMGYRVTDNPTETLCERVGGHDFAIVGRFLVDWWAWQLPSAIAAPVLDLDLDKHQIRRLYGDPNCWSLTPNYERA